MGVMSTVASAAPMHPGAPAGGDAEEHWPAQRLASFLVRLLVVLVPLQLSVVVGLGLAHILPRPRGAVLVAAWWLMLLASSVTSYHLADRGARRLLPLAALLELSMLFPAAAPNRLQVALRAGGVKHLPERLEEARRAGIAGDPSKAAESIVTLVGALSTHHRPSRNHSERVRAYTELIAEQMHLRPRDHHRLRWAALLHDIGKLKLPATLLNGTGDLSEGQWEKVKRHPMDGARLIAPMWDFLGPWAQTIEQHHERHDGTGYPRGLAGDDICLGARIVAVADSYEAMTARRSYSQPMTQVAARKRVAELSGTQFDPEVVRAFLGIPLGKLRWAYGPLAWLAELPGLAALTTGASPALAAAVRVGALAAATGVASAAGAGPARVLTGNHVLSEVQVRASRPAAGGSPAGRSGTNATGDTTGQAGSGGGLSPAGPTTVAGGSTDGGSTGGTLSGSQVATGDHAAGTGSTAPTTPPTTLPPVTVPTKPPVTTPPVTLPPVTTTTPPVTAPPVTAPPTTLPPTTIPPVTTTTPPTTTPPVTTPPPTIPPPPPLPPPPVPPPLPPPPVPPTPPPPPPPPI